MLNNLAEFYPTSIKYVDFGTGAFFTSISIIVVQIIMASMGEKGVNPFLVLGIVSGLILGVYLGIPETLN